MLVILLLLLRMCDLEGTDGCSALFINEDACQPLWAPLIAAEQGVFPNLVSFGSGLGIHLCL